MDEKEAIGTVRKWFLDLWTDMCRALWRTAFEEYNIWRADKIIIKGGLTDEELDKSVDESRIMDLPFPPERVRHDGEDGNHRRA